MNVKKNQTRTKKNNNTWSGMKKTGWGWFLLSSDYRLIQYASVTVNSRKQWIINWFLYLSLEKKNLKYGQANIKSTQKDRTVNLVGIFKERVTTFLHFWNDAWHDPSRPLTEPKTNLFFTIYQLILSWIFPTTALNNFLVCKHTPHVSDSEMFNSVCHFG